MLLQTTKLEREFENDLNSHSSLRHLLLLPLRRSKSDDHQRRHIKGCISIFLSPPLSIGAKKGKNKRGKTLKSHTSLLHVLSESLPSHPEGVPAPEADLTNLIITVRHNSPATSVSSSGVSLWPGRLSSLTSQNLHPLTKCLLVMWCLMLMLMLMLILLTSSVPSQEI